MIENPLLITVVNTPDPQRLVLFTFDSNPETEEYAQFILKRLDTPPYFEWVYLHWSQSFLLYTQKYIYPATNQSDIAIELTCPHRALRKSDYDLINAGIRVRKQQNASIEELFAFQESFFKTPLPT